MPDWISYLEAPVAMKARLMLGVILALSFARVAPAAEPAPDCGVVGLYTTLRLAGRTVTLNEVTAVLGMTPPGGFSMIELRTAAERLGLSLAGINLDQSRGTRLTRPALVYLDRGGDGHYVVLRPVGHSARMVQVFDGVEGIALVDLSALQAAPDWTGIALVATAETAFSSRGAVWVAAISAATMLGSVIAWTRWKRQAV